MRASYPVVHLHVGIQEGEGGGNTMPLNVKFIMRLSSSLSILCEHLAILFFLFFFFYSSLKHFTLQFQRKNVVILIIQETDNTFHDHTFAFEHLHNGNFSYGNTQQAIDKRVKKNLYIKHEVEPHLLAYSYSFSLYLKPETLSPPGTVKQFLYYVLNMHIAFKWYSHLFKMAFI